jgi:hypothetical protein
VIGCTQDNAYFLTTAALVYDMVVEVHTECRGSFGPSNLFQGLEQSSSCHATHTCKYRHLSYIWFSHSRHFVPSNLHVLFQI